MITHSAADIFLDNNGIINIKYARSAVVGLKEAQEFVQIISDVGGGIKRSIIFDTRGTNIRLSGEYREFMGENEKMLKLKKAEAILINSFAMRMLAKFYIKYESPNSPVNFFTNKKDAIEWLSQF